MLVISNATGAHKSDKFHYGYLSKGETVDVVLHGECLSVCMVEDVVFHGHRGKEEDNICVICWSSKVSLKLASVWH